MKEKYIRQLIILSTGVAITFIVGTLAWYIPNFNRELIYVIGAIMLSIDLAIAYFDFRVSIEQEEFNTTLSDIKSEMQLSNISKILNDLKIDEGNIFYERARAMTEQCEYDLQKMKNGRFTVSEKKPSSYIKSEQLEPAIDFLNKAMELGGVKISVTQHTVDNMHMGAWTSGEFDRYNKLNEEAAKKNVEINRLFIFDKTWIVKEDNCERKKIFAALEKQINMNIQIKILFTDIEVGNWKDVMILERERKPVMCILFENMTTGGWYAKTTLLGQKAKGDIIQESGKFFNDWRDAKELSDVKDKFLN